MEDRKQEAQQTNQHEKKKNKNVHIKNRKKNGKTGKFHKNVGQHTKKKIQ